MNFTECEYKYGRAVFQEEIEATNTVPNKVQYVKELRSHLEVGYPDIINRYHRIQKQDEQRSSRIREIMTAQYKCSFQKIIIDRISSSCPKLRNISELRTRSKNILLDEQYNVYDDISIFEIVFTDLFNRWQPGSLEVKDSTELWYKNSETKMIARDTKEDMEKLIELRDSFFHDIELKYY
jgi:hypothetical protein